MKRIALEKHFVLEEPAARDAEVAARLWDTSASVTGDSTFLYYFRRAYIVQKR